MVVVLGDGVDRSSCGTVIDMNEAQVRSIEQMREVLSGETGSTVHGLDRGCGAVQVD